MVNTPVNINRRSGSIVGKGASRGRRIPVILNSRERESPYKVGLSNRPSITAQPDTADKVAEVAPLNGAQTYDDDPTTIQIPVSLVKLLLEHRDAQLEDHALIFPSESGTPLNIQNLTVRHFKPLLKQAGLSDSIRLYDLRHTHATLLLIAGVHPKIVSERLGHASITLTLDTYSHVLPGMQAESALKLEAMLFKSSTEPEPQVFN